MGHLAGFQQAVRQGLTTGRELVFVTCDLLGHTDGLDKSAIGTIDGNGLRIVDVVDDEVALRSCYHTDIVAHTGGTRLYVGQQTVLGC